MQHIAKLKARSRLIKNVKTALENNGFNLPAEIRELKLYNASDPIAVNLMQKAVQQKRQQNGTTKQ